MNIKFLCIVFMLCAACDASINMGGDAPDSKGRGDKIKEKYIGG